MTATRNPAPRFVTAVQPTLDLPRLPAALRPLRTLVALTERERDQALDALRRLAPGLVLSPVTADDLAGRLGIRHYPVLITATGIEQ